MIGGNKKAVAEAVAGWRRHFFCRTEIHRPRNCTTKSPPSTNIRNSTETNTQAHYGLCTESRCVGGHPASPHARCDLETQCSFRAIAAILERASSDDQILTSAHRGSTQSHFSTDGTTSRVQPRKRVQPRERTRSFLGVCHQRRAGIRVAQPMLCAAAMQSGSLRSVFHQRSLRCAFPRLRRRPRPTSTMPSVLEPPGICLRATPSFAPTNPRERFHERSRERPRTSSVLANLRLGIVLQHHAMPRETIHQRAQRTHRAPHRWIAPAGQQQINSRCTLSSAERTDADHPSFFSCIFYLFLIHAHQSTSANSTHCSRIIAATKQTWPCDTAMAAAKAGTGTGTGTGTGASVTSIFCAKKRRRKQRSE